LEFPSAELIFVAFWKKPTTNSAKDGFSWVCFILLLGTTIMIKLLTKNFTFSEKVCFTPLIST
jgi:hypothetical protein